MMLLLLLSCSVAGIQHVAPIEQFSQQMFDRVVSINLTAAFTTIQQCLPSMKQRQWGRIITIASAHGLVASAGKSAYVAAKHGVIGLTKVSALENANTGITCNSICPGWVLTPLVQQQITQRAKTNGTTEQEENIKLLSEKQPQTQFTTPEALGGLVVFLCSDDANTITGTSISMDGAWTAQ